MRLVVRDDRGLDGRLESREERGWGEGPPGDDQGQVVREVRRRVVGSDF